MRSLDRVSHLVGDEQAQFQADIVSREDLLARHEHGGLAQVLGVQREMPTPADVSARAKHHDELALVVKQACVAFRHKERPAECLDHCDGDHSAHDGDTNSKQNFVVHVLPPF